MEVKKICTFDFKEIDITSEKHVYEKYKEEIPVIWINGRKAFKYRLTAQELLKRIQKIG